MPLLSVGGCNLQNTTDGEVTVSAAKFAGRIRVRISLAKATEGRYKKEKQNIMLVTSH